MNVMILGIDHEIQKTDAWRSGDLHVEKLARRFRGYGDAAENGERSYRFFCSALHQLDSAVGRGDF
jgi:hypothetical protein